MSHGQITSRIDGPALRTRREHGGMSLQDLADACKEAGQTADSSQLSRIERELTQPRPRLLLALAKVFGVEVSDLVKKTKAAA